MWGVLVCWTRERMSRKNLILIYCLFAMFLHPRPPRAPLSRICYYFRFSLSHRMFHFPRSGFHCGFVLIGWWSSASSCWSTTCERWVCRLRYLCLPVVTESFIDHMKLNTLGLAFTIYHLKLAVIPSQVLHVLTQYATMEPAASRALRHIQNFLGKLSA